jgi:hypothetical protein
MGGRWEIAFSQCSLFLRLGGCACAASGNAAAAPPSKPMTSRRRPLAGPAGRAGHPHFSARKRAAEAAGVQWAVKEKAKPGRGLTVRQRACNRRFGKVRAKVEHVFRVLKCQFGYRKVRYRGLVKNAAQVFSLLALANLYLVRRTLAPA